MELVKDHSSKHMVSKGILVCALELISCMGWFCGNCEKANH